MDGSKRKEIKEIQQIISDFVFGDSASDDVVKHLINYASQRKENASVLFDVLGSIDAEVDIKKDASFKEKIAELCNRLTKTSIPEEIVRLNFDCFADETTSIRVVKAKTKLFYKQLKFNLLREENEGYSKLIVELCRSDSQSTARVALEKIRCLTGQFNLDPNRILDVILDCFESYVEKYEFFLTLIGLYGCSAQDICHAIGFKFASYKSIRNSSKSTLNFGDSFSDHKPTNNFYLMIALLIKRGLIEMGPLYNYMLPKFDEIRKECEALVDETLQKQKKLAASSIAASDKDAANNSTAAATSSENGPIRIDIADNYKLCLLWALCEIGDWRSAKQMLDRMPEIYAISYVDIATSICRLIDRLIDQLYQERCPLYAEVQKYFDAPCALRPFSEANVEPDDSPNFLAHVQPVLNYEQLIENVFPAAITLGPSMAYDPLVYSKLLRLCGAFIEEKSHNSELERYNSDVIALFEETLVPSLSLFKDGCCVAEELWHVLKLFPYTVRYRCYGGWKNSHMTRHPALVVLKGETTGKTRYIIKRLTKETTKFAGRQLAKLGHSNPIVVFDYILNQIQQFENFILPVVDSLKWMTNLSYDVLAYCIIEHLADPSKEKLKVSDGTLSPWLQSLATFVGSVFKKYNAELTGVLQYVANQLKSGKSFDLCVLREIVENMSGIETTGQLTQEQVEALAGGDILRQEGAYFNQIKNTKRSSNRLKDSLMQEDLVVGLCLLMSQQRYSIVYKEGVHMHLKLVGQMLDQCQETLVQFASFLLSNLKHDDYARCMPEAIDLIKNYHLSLDAAMFLARPVYASKISNIYDELKKVDRTNKTLNAERKVQHYRKACERTLDDLAGRFLTLFPSNFWLDLSPKLFTSFWTLTAYDIHVPTRIYERELDKMRKALQTDESKDGNEHKKKKEREQRLGDEHRRQIEHVARVTQRLLAEKEDWFQLKGSKMPTIVAFKQHCLLPRAVFSDIDALFCAKFIVLMHTLRANTFGILFFYDKIFSDIAFVLCWMSENEANHYGRFLCATIETIQHWLKDKETFDQECGIFPIFMTRLRNTVTNEDSSQPVNYNTYQHLVYKWQHMMIKSLMDYLKSGSYIKIRNALLLLIKVLPCYPMYPTLADLILKMVGEVRDFEKNKRQDLHVLAASYWAQLKLRRSNVITGEFPFTPPKHALSRAPKQAAKKPVVATSAKAAAAKVKPQTTSVNAAPTAAAAAPIKAAPPVTTKAASNKTAVDGVVAAPQPTPSSSKVTAAASPTTAAAKSPSPVKASKIIANSSKDVVAPPPVKKVKTTTSTVGTGVDQSSSNAQPISKKDTATPSPSTTVSSNSKATPTSGRVASPSSSSKKKRKSDATAATPKRKK